MRIARTISLVFVIALASGCTRASEQNPPRRHNLLFVTIDTLRADRLGKGIAPALDRLAAGGVHFVNARTTAPLTLPAHASIMTGQLPPVHGARVNGVPLRDASQSIAARLQRAGYRTGAVVGAFVLDRRFGLAEGFDSYDDRIPRDPDAVDQLEAERAANLVIDSALAWLAKTDGGRPWFLWVHLYDPHAPYNAPGARATTAPLNEAYDAEVSFADAELGRLVSAVDERADRDRTAIVAAGDHGESLGEHGEQTHGMLLFDAALRVPLIISAPFVRGGVRPDTVSVVDVLPTVLALAALPADPLLPGKNLLSPADTDREVYAETEYPAVAGWHPARVLVQDRWKLVMSARPRLFDLTADPPEATDLAQSRTPLVSAMRKRLSELSRPASTAVQDRTTVDAETAARLRALGYVAPTAAPPAVGSGTDAADVIADWASFEHGLSAQNAGRNAEALSAFARLAQKYPDGPVFQASHARALADAGFARQALAIYSKAVSRWPGDASLYHDLAVAARTAGDAVEARRAEQAALAVAPNLASAHNGLGLLEGDAGRHAEAGRAFERAVELDPTNASYVVNLGNARRALGQLDAAATAYRQALERDPTLADAANGLGVVLVQQKRAAEAVAYLEQAVSRAPAFAEAQLNLGIALQENGQRDRALAQYRVVERIAPPHSRERDAARVLRQQLERR